MRGVAVALIVGACIAGAALAQVQDATPTASVGGAGEAFEPQWEERPSARDFARHMPDEAVSQRTPGVVHLCCTPNDDRRLDCRVAFEWPREHGFGAGVLRASRGFRLTLESQAAFRADPDAWLQIPVVFRSSRSTPALEDALARIREGTQGLCAPTGANPGPPQEPILVTVS